MTPIKNGPARNTPKGARLTRADLAATVPAAPPRCACPSGRGTPVVTFHDQVVLRVERRHLTSRYGCLVPTQHEYPEDFLADLRTGRR